jgi:signal transduction histidine kinase
VKDHSGLTGPPLTRWQVTWRNLAAVAFGAMVTSVTYGPADWAEVRVLFAVDLALGAVCLVLMQFRRRWPLGVALATNTLGSFSASASGTLYLTLISLSTRRRWREILPVAIVNMLGGVLFFRVQPVQGGAWFFDLVLSGLAAGIAIAIGLYVGARRELLASLQDRAERAEREQALRVVQARTGERARIAREMHDVLAHRISLVAVHAGALAYRTDLSPEETRDAAEIIQDNAHRALTDLREILGLLRDQDVDAPERPQPTLRDLPELIAEERGAGAHIKVNNALSQFDEIPDAVARNAYRLLQETLTNARKHAPDATVTVDLEGHPGARLMLRVSNPMRVGSAETTPPGSGLGLIGLAERAELGGGRLEQKRTPSGDFVVTAWLPWPL